MSNKTDLSRRSFLKTTATGAGAVAVTGCGGLDDVFGDDDKDNDSADVAVFSHGVASGDPLTDAVIIWTRITPANEESAESITVEWSISENSDMSSPVQSGSVVTNSEKDFTVKVDVTELQAGTTYYYRFTGPDDSSPIGQTQTLPEGEVSAIKFAVCSCANYPAGFFNVYEEISTSDADIVLHLGDYIYEYQSGTYPSVEDQVTNRAPDPSNEIISLADYRKRYAQYRRDVQLQAAHKAKPFICVWDDHELANDAYVSGAENHNDDEGDFATRRAEAFQAYHEWMPIRSGSDLSNIYRQFEIGNLVNLQMLDTRHVGRDKPISIDDHPGLDSSDSTTKLAAINALEAEMNSENRTLLGDEQRTTVVTNMVNSDATWQVFGQQVLMGRMLIPAELMVGIEALTAKLSAGEDATAEQDELIAAIPALYGLKQRALDGDDTLTTQERERIETVLPYNLDAWDGYGYDREFLLKQAAEANKNLVVLAGDTHNAWANELRLLEANDAGNTHVGVEFATSSVTSPGFDEYLALEGAFKVFFETAIATLADDLRFMDATRRGYLTVEFTPEKATGEWVFVNDVKTKEGITTDSQYVQLGGTYLAKFEVAPNGATTSAKLTQATA